MNGFNAGLEIRHFEKTQTQEKYKTQGKTKKSMGKAQNYRRKLRIFAHFNPTRLKNNKLSVKVSDNYYMGDYVGFIYDNFFKKVHF